MNRAGIMGISFCIFLAGYVAGEQQALEKDYDSVRSEDDVGKPVEVVTQWKFPAQCYDTIVEGMQTTWANKERINRYEELAVACFETVGQEVPNVTYELPPPAVYVIPNEDSDSPVDQVLIENAYLDCVDDMYDEMNDETENYCDENYEDYLP